MKWMWMNYRMIQALLPHLPIGFVDRPFELLISIPPVEPHLLRQLVLPKPQIRPLPLWHLLPLDCLPRSLLSTRILHLLHLSVLGPAQLLVVPVELRPAIDRASGSHPLTLKLNYEVSIVIGSRRFPCQMSTRVCYLDFCVRMKPTLRISANVSIR
jgi:hypothetical protein